MLLKFKTCEKLFKANSAVESKIYRAGVGVGWVMSLSLQASLASIELDKLLTGENISEITLTTEKGDAVDTKVITGYDKVSSCSIKHTDTQDTVEIQVSKGV